MARTRRLDSRTALQLRDMRRTLRAVLGAYPGLAEENGWLKAQLFAELRRELAILACLEEEIVYPALEAAAARAVAQGREEHELIGVILDELAALTPGEGAFDFRMHLLTDVVERHALLEEEELFPRLLDFDEARQNALWETFRARKLELRGLPARAS